MLGEDTAPLEEEDEEGPEYEGGIAGLLYELDDDTDPLGLE